MNNPAPHSSGIPDSLRVQQIRRMNNLSPNLKVFNGMQGTFHPRGWDVSTPIQYIQYDLDVQVPDGFEFVVPRYFMFETEFARRRGQAYLDEALTQEVPKGMVGNGNALTLYIKAPQGIPSDQLAQCTVEIFIQYFKKAPAAGKDSESFNVAIPYHLEGPAGPIGSAWLMECQADVYRADGTGLRFQMPYWHTRRKPRLVLTWD